MLRRPAVIAMWLLACALVAPAAAQAHTGDAVTMEGTLEFRHSDNFRSGTARYYYALRQGERRTRLEFGRFRTDLRNGAKLRVRGTLVDGRLSVEHLQRLRREPLRAFDAIGPGPRRVAVLLVNFADNPSQPFTPAQAASTMFTSPASVSAYFQEESFGATTMSGDVFGWYNLPVPSTGCAFDTWATAANTAAIAAGVNLSSYQHLVYAFPSVSSCGWAGLAEMPGSRVWINGSFTLRTLGHELTHNLGTHHAATLSCTSGSVRVTISGNCSYSEYGDPFDIMGASSRHTSAWHKGQIGWLDPLAKQTVTASGTYTITPQEWSTGGVQSLRIARGSTGNFFYLEYRRPFGTAFDTFSLTDPAVNGVTIRMAPEYTSKQLSYLLDTTPATSTFTDAPLATGQTFTDATYAISITTAAVSATGATVQISLGGTPPPPPPTDTTAPSAPGTLTGQVLAGPAVTMSWGAATDDSGVAGYRVFRDGVQLVTTAGLSYVDSAPPIGSTIAYTVRAYDAAGNVGAPSNALTFTISGPTPPPPPPPTDTAPANTVPPSITGTLVAGSTLTANVGTWSGTTPMTFAIRWTRCSLNGGCSTISGATASTYRLTSKDVGRTIRISVTATNVKGSSTVISARTGVVGGGSGAAKSSSGLDAWDSMWASTAGAEQQTRAFARK